MFTRRPMLPIFLLSLSSLFHFPHQAHSSSRRHPLLMANNANGNGQFNCATLPPALWCACDEIQQKCGFAQQCAEYANAVRNQPVHITLLYESLCPDCQQFISNKLYDVYQRFKPNIRLELVPFGNAKVLGNGTIQCQHGPEECRINKWESCAIHFMAEPFPFIYCLETLIANGMRLEKAAKQCYAKLHPIPHIFDQIMHCFMGTKGDELQKIDAQKTAAVWPDQHEYVPWILVNNASLQSQQFLMQDLPALICQSYVGDTAIDHCDASKAYGAGDDGEEGDDDDDGEGEEEEQ